MIGTVLLYVAVNCHWCDMSEKVLAENCIAFRTTKVYTEIARVRPILVIENNHLIGYDSIKTWAEHNNQCKKK